MRFGKHCCIGCFRVFAQLRCPNIDDDGVVVTSRILMVMVVHEKEKKIREGMKMMGLESVALW